LKSGLAYVKLEGRVGVLGNGAGLVMATLDTIHHYGEKAADFLDLGGGATTDRIKTAIEIVISDPDVSAVLVNILGGLTKCDEVARAIVETRQEFGDAKPIIARLVGTNEEEGRRILAQAGVQVMESMEEAVNHVVEEIRNRTDPGWA
jgi:succinyl-CoA synthetase beta subunit